MYSIVYSAPSHPSAPLTSVGPTVVTVLPKLQAASTVGIPSTISSRQATVSSAGHSIVGGATFKVNV